jgi:hypothetical protein
MSAKSFRGTFQQCANLSPLYFHIWGHIKTLVYSVLIEKKKHFANAFFYACRTNCNRPRTFKRVRQSKIRYVHAGDDSDGGRFEHLL